MQPVMQPAICLLPNAVSDIFAQASHSGKLTPGDRYGLMAAMLSESLENEDRQAIERMLYAIRRGRLSLDG